MSQLDIDKFEVDPFVISDLIISGGGLVCSHCGRRITIDELLDYKILIGNEEGYLSHIDCLINYIMKAEPTISSGLASGLFSESKIRQDLLSRPFESVVLDISRACSFKHLSPLTDKCSKFIASESTLIEARNNHNLEILLDYLDNTFNDPTYSDIN
jgi:hypothetical protein